MTRVLLALTCCLLTGIDAKVLPESGRQARTCGYDACPKTDPNKLNIHLVPHTHDDVGWLKTVDQYFYGQRNDVQRADVQKIIDSVVEELRKSPDRRFIYVETAYLWKWWKLQNNKTREEVRAFINDGRLEITGGAWSMNDEATTYYQSIIDQFTWGLRRLNDTFGECARPKIGWQIDPFGHSREQASIFAQLGFDGLFVGRVDYRDKAKRLRDRTAEFLWQASPNLGKQADLFTAVLYNNYGPPPGFCFDVLCQNHIDDTSDENSNANWMTEAFYKYVTKQATHYKMNNVIVTMGGDFTYQRAEIGFTNMDRLIKYMSERYGDEVNVFYSTPSCYLKSLHEADKTWTTKTDDFFPYADQRNSYWTGYFTSRPTLKYFERLGNNFLQVVKQLSVLSNEGDSEDLQLFREVMGVMQHHDAITGTEKQHVADDYAKLLYDAIHRGEEIASNALAKLSTRKNSAAPTQDFKSCLLLNISSCQPTEDSKTFVITLYNPRSHPATTYVRVPVRGSAYAVTDFTGSQVLTQLVPIPKSVLGIPGRRSDATRELVFRASNVPPLGFQSFYVTERSSEDVNDEVNKPEEVSSIGGDLYDISVDAVGRVIIQYKNKDLRVVQAFQYYEGTNNFRPSGAYILRPKTSQASDFNFTGSYEIYRGPLVEELHLTVNDYISQVIRVYGDEERIEFEWLVGPIPTDDGVAREVITKYSSNLTSNEAFYTDSNGREMIKRVRDFGPLWDLDLKELIPRNYYPVTTKISLQDDRGLRMSVLTDRAQGGSSMNDGELELMLHRRLVVDDRLGVGEALNERAFGVGLVARGIHYLIASGLEADEAASGKEKSLALSLSLRAWMFITPVEDFSFEKWRDNYAMRVEGLRKKLPPNVHIMTLESWRDDEILVRLEHLFEVGEAADMSEPVAVDLTDLFAGIHIIAVRETTLGGNQWIEDMQRLDWRTESDKTVNNMNNPSSSLNIESGTHIVMKPMQIRTFIVSIKWLGDS